MELVARLDARSETKEMVVDEFMQVQQEDHIQQAKRASCVWRRAASAARVSMRSKHRVRLAAQRAAYLRCTDGQCMELGSPSRSALLELTPHLCAPPQGLIHKLFVEKWMRFARYYWAVYAAAFRIRRSPLDSD